MIGFTTQGDWAKTESWLKGLTNRSRILAELEKYGKAGVAALSAATPVESGLTAASWTYEVTQGAEGYSIVWRNTHHVGGTSVAILLQYGHGTGTGGYVQGRDYINPAIRPIFDQIADGVWKVVTSG